MAMRQYLIRLKRKARKEWWWVLVIPLWWLVQDRLTTFANKLIDESSPDVLRLLPTALNWANANPSWLLLAVVIILGIAIALGAYFDRDLNATSSKATALTHNATGETIAEPRRALIEEREPDASKLALNFDINEEQHFPKKQELLSHDNYYKKSQRVVAITIRNMSMDSIKNVKLYCLELEVLTDGINELRATGADDNGQDLMGGEPHVYPVLLEKCTLDGDTHKATQRSYEVLCPLKCKPFVKQGSEFRMKLVAYGEGTYPTESWFRFGVRDVFFLFEQEH